MTPVYPYHTGEYLTDKGVKVLPCKHCKPGHPCATYRGTFDPVPDTDAPMFIQWKGTSVCMDFHCPCGTSSHIDADFTYYVRCPGCGAVYELGTQVRARRLAEGETPDGTPIEGEPW